MTFELYKQVALPRDIREDGLCDGDVVTVVDRHPSPEPRGEEGYSLEVFNAIGETIVMTVAPASVIKPLRED